MLIGVDAEYSAAVVDDRIHVIGGRIDGATVPFSAPKTSAHQVYDIASNAWSLAAPLPGASRSEMCAVVHEDNIYVMGGNIVPFDGAVASVDIYDAEEGTWRAGPPMPAPRANAVCAALGDSIYVIGGIHPFGIFHSDVFRFDVERGTWTTVTSAPEPIATAETPGIRHGRRIFVVGGGFFGSGGGAVGTTNQSFRPRSEEEDEGE